MKNKMLNLLLLVMLIMLVLTAVWSWQYQAMQTKMIKLEPGKTKVYDLRRRKPAMLSSYVSDRKINLIFYTSPVCGYCKKQRAMLANLPKAVRDKINIIDVLSDTNDFDRWSSSYLYDHDHVVFDRAKEFAKRTGLYSTPTLVFIGKDGKILLVQVGYLGTSLWDEKVSKLILLDDFNN